MAVSHRMWASSKWLLPGYLFPGQAAQNLTHYLRTQSTLPRNQNESFWVLLKWTILNMQRCPCNKGDVYCAYLCSLRLKLNVGCRQQMACYHVSSRLHWRPLMMMMMMMMLMRRQTTMTQWTLPASATGASAQRRKLLWESSRWCCQLVRRGRRHCPVTTRLQRLEQSSLRTWRALAQRRHRQLTDVISPSVLTTLQVCRQQWVSRVQRPHRHTIGHFGDVSFQSITCTGTDDLPNQVNQEAEHKRT